MKKLKIFILVIFFTSILFSEIKAQDSLKYFLNVGYITNLKKCPECTRADAGGSVRIGILTKKRLGFYTGYLWFKEFHPDYIEYDDQGYGFVLGMEYLLLKRNNFQWYLNLGLFNEKYKSTYSSRTEIETSIIPDFGLLFQYNHFNIFLGSQPSDPNHINFGVGFTF